MKSVRLFFCIFLTGITVLSKAQYRVVLENVRYATVINYFEDTALQRGLQNHLQKLFQTGHQVSFVTTDTLPMQKVSANQSFRINTRFRGGDTTLLHLILDIVEIAPLEYYQSLGTEPVDATDSALRADTRTAFRYGITIINDSNALVYNRYVDAVIYNTRTAGMGIVSPYVKLLPRSFLEVTRKMLDVLIGQNDETDQLVMGIAPVYAADNFYMPMLANRRRYQATVNPSFNSFSFDYGGASVLRKDKPLFEELQIKGRRTQTYAKEIMEAVDRAENSSRSTFVFLKQEWRDVLEDRNYQLRLFTQIDPNKNYGTVSQALTGFLPGDLHLLMEGKDTVARFSIDKYVTDKEKKVFPYRVYNGVDSSSMYRLADSDIAWPLKYNYVAKGKIQGKDFQVNVSGQQNNIKEIYLDGQLVAIAQGLIGPEVFAVFDASLSPGIMKQLFMIGFNSFFE